MARKLTEKEKLECAKADLGYYLKQERFTITIKQLAIAKALCRIIYKSTLIRTAKRQKKLWLYKKKTIERKFVNRGLIHSVAYAKKRFDEIIDEKKSASSNKAKVLYLALLHDLAPASAVEIAFQKYAVNSRLKKLHYSQLNPLKDWKEVIDIEIETIKKLREERGITTYSNNQ